MAAAGTYGPGLLGALPGTAAAGFGSGTPGFGIYAAPSSLNNHDNAGEPSIGVHWNTGAVMYQAFSSSYMVAFNDATTPATATWTDTNAPNVINIDPILATDHTTGRTWAGGLAGSCSQLAFSDNDGGSWTPSNPCSGTVDHETVGSGPYAGAAPLGATYGHAAYYCAQAGVQVSGTGDACITSTNGGLTWGAPTPGGCGGLHGHVKVRADGTAYVPNRDCDLSVNLVGGGMSTSNGASWTSYSLGQPSPSRGFDPSVATTPDNTVYEAWSRADSYDPMVAWSSNHGSSWTVKDLAGTVPGLTASTFQATVAGDNGRAAVAFLGSTTGTAGLTPFDNGYNGSWYLYVSYTYDGGASWTTVNATPNDPVQRGCIWDGGGSNVCRNLLDFMDASVTKDGRVVVGFADGCIGTCDSSSGTAAQSTDAWATLARQSAGEGLFSAFDTTGASPTPSSTSSPLPSPSPSASPSASPSPSPTPAVDPSAPQNLVARTATKRGVTLSWQAPASSGSSALTGYDLYRGTSCNGLETLYKSLGTGTTYTDTGAKSGVTYCYYVTAVNAAGQSPPSNQASATGR